MPKLTAFTSYADAQTNFSSEKLWELFDGNREHLHIAHECVDRHALEGQTAVIVLRTDAPDELISYEQLAKQSSQMANFLSERGIKKGDRVAVMLEPSLAFYTCLFGIMKAGGAYVPLDPYFPEERLAFMLARALAPTGALMCFLALWTGALWGKPTWGTWWVWDARLTSELLLLFLYLGFMALQAAADDPRRADRAGAIMALVGVVNVPIIYFSVKWWNTLHQGSSVSFTKGSSMAAPMLAGMLVMALAFWAYCIAVSLARLRVVILEREQHTQWVRAELGAPR